jgi:hypothetical protein
VSLGISSSHLLGRWGTSHVASFWDVGDATVIHFSNKHKQNVKEPGNLARPVLERVRFCRIWAWHDKNALISGASGTYSVMWISVAQWWICNNNNNNNNITSWL